jgi:hypothetical protein
MPVTTGRRELLAALGAAIAWPLAARTQQPGKTTRVGYIRAGSPTNDPFREEFVRHRPSPAVDRRSARVSVMSMGATSSTRFAIMATMSKVFVCNALSSQA